MFTSVIHRADTYLAVAPAVWYDFNFVASFIQALATQYAIVVRAPAAVGGNWINWRADTSAATYTGGQILTSPNSGTNWFPVATEDFMFGCWGEIT